MGRSLMVVLNWGILGFSREAVHIVKSQKFYSSTIRIYLEGSTIL